jgi:DNA-binding beta-propeller fold protein YncE
MQNLKNSEIEIKWTAPPSVSKTVSSLGRTEDVCFSPNNRRLAVAAFSRNRIVVFNIKIVASAIRTQIELTGVADLSSPALNGPHGLKFIDDETLIVTSREGDISIFQLPVVGNDVLMGELMPVQTLIAGEKSLVKSPGSVSVIGVESGLYKVLICNNYINTVTSHLLNSTAGYTISNGEILLQKWIYVPDGIAVSPDQQWIAVSNHETHSVMLYEYMPSLNMQNDPDGILHGVDYPHGLCFSSDGSYLFVADAGAPYIHIFARHGDGWRGVRNPAASIRVMDERQFLLGRYNPQEGGPKGLGIDASMTVLVVTSEFQPLSFFDVPAIIERAAANSPHGLIDGQIPDRSNELSERERNVLEISRELSDLMRIRASEAVARASEAEFRANEAEALVNMMTSSKSWQITAPLRRLYSAMQSSR